MLIRLRRARAELGIDVPIIHLAHSLELRYQHPIARRVVDAEVVLTAEAEPEFGWQAWDSPLDEYPVSSLLALEAVQAARLQSDLGAEQLDYALREAFFKRSRCITMRHEILAAAQTCDLDIAALRDALDSGVARAAVLQQSTTGDCSGVVVLPDGSEHCNPGTQTGWIGAGLPKALPRIISDDPSVYRDLVARAAGVLV